jgi:hypothetical protein
MMLGSCPVGFGADLSPEARDAARDVAMRAVRGDGPAAERPALGFTLDTTTRAEVAAWATDHGVLCTDKATTTRCSAVPAVALGAAHDVDSVTFQFDSSSHLVGVSSELTAASPDEAVKLVTDASATLATRAGPPTSQHGEASGAWLAKGAMNQLATEFRFVDYRAQVTATNLGSGRVKVREVYQSIGAGS